jgi:peptide deformylase
MSGFVQFVLRSLEGLNMIRQICRMGNPVLRKRAKKISREDIISESFTLLLRDMRDSMKHYGGIGIAAPQLGESLAVAIIDLPPTNRYGEEASLAYTVFINPEIEYLTKDEQGFWEGCLSVPGLRGLVERPKKVRVTYLNEAAKEQMIEAEGFLATVLQHELDHLWGKLYIDRIKDPSLLSYQEEYDAFIENGKDLE